MVKGKFQEYPSAQQNSWTYSCLYCRAHLARHDDLISKSFQGSQGRAYLFHQVTNVEYSEAKQRVLLTGIHFVADVFCACCQTMLGWKYERAFEPSQRYKEEKVIIELAHLIKDNGWDSEWFNPPRAFSLSSSPNLLTPMTHSPLFRNPKAANLDTDFVAPQPMPSDNQHSSPDPSSIHNDFVEAPFAIEMPNSFASSSCQSVSFPHDIPFMPLSQLHESSTSTLCPVQSTNTTNACCSAFDINVADDRALLANSSVERIGFPVFGEHDQSLPGNLNSASSLSRPPSSLSQEPFSGQMQHRRKRPLFHRRSYSNSPSRSSLLPLVADCEMDGGEGNNEWLNHSTETLTPHKW